MQHFLILIYANSGFPSRGGLTNFSVLFCLKLEDMMETVGTEHKKVLMEREYGILLALAEAGLKIVDAQPHILTVSHTIIISLFIILLFIALLFIVLLHTA